IERLIEDSTELRGRDRRALEADRADAARRIAMAEEFESARLLQLRAEPVAERDFVLADGLGRALLDEVETGDETRNAEHVGCASLEEVWELARLDRVRRVAASAPLAPGTQIRPRANV